MDRGPLITAILDSFFGVSLNTFLKYTDEINQMDTFDYEKKKQSLFSSFF